MKLQTQVSKIHNYPFFLLQIFGADDVVCTRIYIRE